MYHSLTIDWSICESQWSLRRCQTSHKLEFQVLVMRLKFSWRATVAIPAGSWSLAFSLHRIKWTLISWTLFINMNALIPLAGIRCSLSSRSSLRNASWRLALLANRELLVETFARPLHSTRISRYFRSRYVHSLLLCSYSLPRGLQGTGNLWYGSLTWSLKTVPWNATVFNFWVTLQDDPVNEIS